MSSSRVSFGSRAGTVFDYPGGQQHDVTIRTSTGAYNTLDALADALKIEIAAASEGDEPECTTLSLSLSADAMLELVRPGVGPYSDGGEQDLPVEFKQMYAEEDENDDHDENATTSKRHRNPWAYVANTINITDARQSSIVQRAASRGIMQAIENADGFRYSFNNAWNAKDGEGSRFSYICQDSMQNKDRHANGYPRTVKHLKGDVGSRGPRKPTYDCKGSVSIKFSTARQRCDVYYRHYVIHSTVADRARMPRPPAVRRPFVSKGALHPQVVDGDSAVKRSGGLLATLQAEAYANSALAMVDRTEPSNIGRPLKRKRDPGPASSRSIPSKPLSLVELLSQSESAKALAPESESTARQKPSHHPAPIAYDVPSWQVPPPVLNGRRQDGATAGYPAPYRPPYQPMQHCVPTTPPVARQPVQHRPPFQQKIAGQPIGNHPKAQGLFTTLKPVGDPALAGPPGITYAPSAIIYQNRTQNQDQDPSIIGGYEMMQRQRRARTSCVRCRLGKRKCDEGQPCSACIKGGVGALDCVYEGLTPQATDPTSFTPGGNRLPWTAHEKPPALSPGEKPTFPQTSGTAPGQRLPWEISVPRTNSSTQASSTAWRPPVTISAGAGRASSPDPWFPKR